ncbi:CDP-glycerol glycerophosphotransferase family protein [Candidatus Saccharibacteria bacterium]|nr:CDP-glycerol glycerophosphotransferase family protein [Candidatus Saccharibacteria bacterium]
MIIKRLIFRITYFIICVFTKVDDNKIVITNYYGKGYGDNGKYICDELIRRDGKYNIVWLVEDINEKMPSRVKVVKIKSIRSFYELATAKIWIDNCRKPYYLRKKKNQFYIQTWHGSFAIKKIEEAAEKELDKVYILNAKNDSKMMDLALSSNRLMTEIYEKYFWYNGQILECGCPRNDIIINQPVDIKEKIINACKLDKGINICLYAPTFRKDKSLAPYNINYEELRKELKKKFGGRWAILIRLHPNITAKSKELNFFNEYIKDVSRYSDMQELLAASDFMITDYSSCIFDYALSKKPCCIYASDIEKYVDDRGFNISLNEYPFDIARNNDELSQTIASFDTAKFTERINAFYRRYRCKEDGKASRLIVDIIDAHMKGK